MRPVTVTPDCGWAWVVLAGAFLSQLLCSLYATVGIFNVIFLEVFQQSAVMTAWLVGVHSALVSLMGPVASVIINRHGLRVSLFIGGGISFCGFFFTFFAQTLSAVFLFYGLMAGSGLGIVYTTATTLPSIYFNKYRDLANGVSMAGLAVGMCSLTPLIQHVRSVYGWRGGMLIMSGLTLHILVAGAVVRPVAVNVMEEKVEERAEKKESLKEINANTKIKDTEATTVSELMPQVQVKTNAEENSANLNTKGNNVEISANSGSRGAENLNIKGNNIEISANSGSEDAMKLCGNHETSEHIHSIKGRLPHVRHKDENDHSQNLQSLTENVGLPLSSKDTEENTDKLDLDSTPLPEGKSLISNSHYPQSDTSYTASSDENSITSAKTTKATKIFHCEIFREPLFVILCFYLMFTNIATSTFYTFVPVMAMEHGTDSADAGYLIAVSGVVGVAARIMIGAIANFGPIHIYLLNSLTSLICGILLLQLPYNFSTYLAQLVCVICIGVVIVSVYVLMPGTCIEILDVSCISTAVGISSLMYGIGFLIGPPTGGLLFDITGHYDYAFIVAGAAYVLSAALTGFMFVYHKLKVARKAHDAEDDWKAKDA